MTHWKGPAGEREIERLFQEAGFPKARRALGEGRKDDMGDMGGLPRLCLQVFRRGTNLTNSIYAKLPESEQQRINRKVPFGAMFARLDRRPWIVVMTPKMFLRMYHYALIGYDKVKEERRVKLAADVHRDGRRQLIDGSRSPHH